MSEEAEAAKEAAKAVQEVAKTSGKAIDAGRDAGGFFARFLEGSLEQAFGMLEDRLKVWWFNQLLKLQDEVKARLAARKMSGPTRAVPPKVAIPLLEEASLEGDAGLRELWARLLVNAGDANSPAVPRAFVGILGELSSFDARCFKTLAEASRIVPGGPQAVVTQHLPDRVAHHSDGGLESGNPGRSTEPVSPPREVQVALDNLRRLGLIEFAVIDLSGLSYASAVALTPLGYEFVRALSLWDA